MLPFEGDQVKEIWPAIRGEFNRADKLHDLVISLFFDPSATGTRFRGVNELVLVTVMALLARVCRTHRAVSHAAVNGLGEDAMTLARSMYETAMIALFILQRPNKQKQRSAMYHGWSAHQTMKMLRMWRQTQGLKRQAKKADLARAQVLIEAWDSKAGGADVSRHWSGTGSLEGAARVLREDKSYQTLYRYLSSYGHGADVAGGIEVADDGKYVIELIPNPKHCNEALELSQMILWVLCARIDKVWGFGFADRLVTVKPQHVRPI